jgi:hypothetical protein
VGGERVGDGFGGVAVDLGHVDDEAAGRVEAAAAVQAFEVFGFLVQNEHLFVFKLAVAVPSVLVHYGMYYIRIIGTSTTPSVSSLLLLHPFHYSSLPSCKLNILNKYIYYI